MDWKKLAFSVLGASLALLGCDSGVEFPARNFQCEAGAEPPCDTTEPAEPESARTVSPAMDMEDTTYTYVVGAISIPKATPEGEAAGFNLDGMDSGAGSTAGDATCQQFAEDFVNVDEPSHRGVDNALQGLVMTIESLLDAADCPGMQTAGCLDATLQQQIAEGDLLLLVEVSGVNSFEFDESVTLQLFLGELPEGETPTIGADGSLEAGQSFMTAQELGPPVEGDIFRNRLRASTELLTLMVNAGGFMLPLEIRSAEVRFDISADGMGSGQIGGFLRTDDLVAAASEIMPGVEMTVRSVVENVADVEPSDGDPMVCDSVSVGLVFSGTTAVRS